MEPGPQPEQPAQPERPAPPERPERGAAPPAGPGGTGRVGRRGFLTGGAVAGGAAAAAVAGYAVGASQGGRRPDGSPADRPRTWSVVGAHQPGIVDPQSAAGLVAAFDVLAKSRYGLADTLEIITGRAERLMAGGRPPARGADTPPADSGILGPVLQPDGLTVTVAFGASLFDRRYGLGRVRPRRLRAMPAFPNDDLDPDRCHGDLLVQLCAGHRDTVLHALRELRSATAQMMELRWMLEGFQRPNTLGPGRTSVRNLLGFKDGTANPDPTDGALMDRLVWVQPGAGEPAWTAGGTYLVARIIKNFVERWDAFPLEDQERVIGRHRESGAPLGRRREQDEPDYRSDPKGLVIAADAHIRLANPRTPQTEAQRILRRGFNYARDGGGRDAVDTGLLFVSFQQDLERGFVSVQRRLAGEPLEEFIQPVGGGFFFVPPGVAAPGGYLGEGMIAAAGA
jgi:deferrochelatase/peroxidase EfeB